MNEPVFFEGRRLGAVDWNGVVDEPHGAAFVPTRLHTVQSAAERP